MKAIGERLSQSEYVTVDAQGWHISDDAPDDVKKEFDTFIQQAKDGGEIILE